MKVTCDNCGAVYRIPEEKLTKDVSRATCKKCGNKIVIRKPSGALGDHALGGNYGFDEEDDAIVNHEERTVIATVPELQRFDATPPLSVPGSTPDLDSITSFDDSDATTDAVPVEAVARSTPAAAPSPAGPSEPASAAPKGVPIPSQMRLEVGALPLIMVALSIVGTLLFVPDSIWGSSTLTAAGFGLALYGELAVLMALIDLRAQRSPRPQLVFLVPAAVCIITLVVLITLQKKELAFLDSRGPEMAVLETGEVYTLPDGTSYQDVVMVDERTGRKKTVRKKVEKPLAKDAGGNGFTTKQGEDGTVIAAPNANPNGGPLFPDLSSDRKAQGPEGMKTTSLVDNTLSKDKVRSIVLNDEGVVRCLRAHSSGISGALIYEVTLLQSGKVKDAGFPKSSVYRLSEFEKCLNERVSKITTFPSFEGKSTQETVEVKFIF